jgi:hypothetical protein
MTRLQESRIVEISPSGLTRGVGLTTHSYSTSLHFFRRPSAEFLQKKTKEAKKPRAEQACGSVPLFRLPFAFKYQIMAGVHSNAQFSICNFVASCHSSPVQITSYKTWARDRFCEMPANRRQEKDGTPKC